MPVIVVVVADAAAKSAVVDALTDFLNAAPGMYVISSVAQETLDVAPETRACLAVPTLPLALIVVVPKTTLATSVVTPPMRTLAETLAVPVTANLASGAVLEIPTLPL